MERAKCKIVFLCLFIFVADLKGSYKSEIYSAYINNRMQLWKTVIDNMNKIKNKDTGILLELLNYQYGYIAWCIGNNKNDEARTYLTLAEENFVVLPENDHYQSIVNAYKAAFYGYRIGLNHFTASYYGLKSIECAKLALKLDNENPLAHIQRGNIEYYMPSFFGGSKTEAIKYYLQAKELMEKNKNDLFQDWNYLNLLTIIAQAYSAIKDYKTAEVYYKKLLSIEPDFSWVRNELYPEINKKMKY
jgi:tetratricopeptide (TPR) repeat protein